MSEKLYTNLFEIENQNDLTVEYRTLAIRNLPNDDREKNLQLLKTNIAYDLREPVALIRRDGEPSLVLPASAKLPELRQQLTPHVVELEPAFDTQMLDFTALTAQNTGIAIEFLSYSLRGSLMRRNDLWKSGNGWFRKQADESASNDDVAVYPGFSWQVVEHRNGRLHIALASSVRYVDSKWLSERYNALNPQEFRNEHCLYHFGDQWYPIQILSVCPLSIGEQQFKLDGGGTATVLAYTQTKHPRNARVAALDASSPAITYRYPNRLGLTRYGSLALCKRTIKTDEIGGARRDQIHSRAALKPQRRVHLASRDIREFTGAKLAGIPLRIGRQPLEVERKIFPVPALRFGHERVLRTDDASLHQYPRERQRLLESPNAGPLMRDPLAAQYIILPQSMPRAIAEDFHTRIQARVADILQKPAYRLQRVVYDDERARTVPRQTQAISEALNRANARSGRALLVLPETARPDLHHHVKTANWPDLQFQCADAARIRRFYRYRPGNGLEVLGDRRGRYSGYVGKLACALLIVNRQWAWCLNNPLHADLIVGIDVLHGRAGFTFVYDHGAQIVFKDAKSHRPEQLSRDLMRDTISRGVRSDLRRETERRAAIRSLTVHRDGRVYDSERAGICAAVRQLISEGLLTNDVRVTIVAIPKKTSINLRLFAGPTSGEVRNPRIGSYLVLNEREGVVATTGYPFNLPGTAIPLHASIVEGDMPIEQVLQDIFCLAQLAFSAPDLPLRTPISIKLANDFLEPIAARFDMETALYEGDEGEDAVASEPARARVAEIVSGGASA